MPKKKKRAQLRVGRVILAVLVVAGIIVGIIFLLKLFAPNCASSKPGNTPSKEVMPEQTAAEGDYIEILQEDCEAYVGTVMLLTCDANPRDLLASIKWSSTDEKIVHVDGDGRVEVVGKGNAAVIAISGIYSDSVIITGIEEGESISTENPFAPSQPNEPEGPPVEGDSDHNHEAEGKDPAKEMDSTVEPASSEPVTNEQPSRENQPDEGGNEGNPGDHEEPISPDNPSDENASTKPTKKPDSEYVDYEVVLGDCAMSSGFSASGEGTYVYREDGNYLGQAVVQGDKLTVYVKERTSTFDQVVKTLLSQILPTKYETAYAMMLSASTTDTITLDGHSVSAIAFSSAAEHRQLIVRY